MKTPGNKTLLPDLFINIGLYASVKRTKVHGRLDLNAKCTEIYHCHGMSSVTSHIWAFAPFSNVQFLRIDQEYNLSASK